MKTGILSLLFLNCSLVLTLTAQTKWATIDNQQSVIQYKLTHPLHEIEAVSHEMESRVEINDAAREVRKVTAQVDVATFNSGNSNRDSHAMEVIDALTYPEVTFSSTSVTRAGDSLKVNGNLTFHGVTNGITMTVFPVWSAHTLQVAGRFDVSLTAFKIERPSLLMIPVHDLLEFTINATYQY
jgi:polyisoprenoid-binding protein YceI